MYPRIVVIFWHCRRPYMFSWSWRLPQLRRLSRCDSNARWGGRWGKCVRWRHFERERVNEWPTWPSSRGSWPTSLLSCRFRYVRTTNGQISGVPSAPVDTTQDVIPYCSNWLHSFILTLAACLCVNRTAGQNTAQFLRFFTFTDNKCMERQCRLNYNRKTAVHVHRDAAFPRLCIQELYSSGALTLWRVPYGYSCKASCARPG